MSSRKRIEDTHDKISERNIFALEERPRQHFPSHQRQVFQIPPCHCRQTKVAQVGLRVKFCCNDGRSSICCRSFPRAVRGTNPRTTLQHVSKKLRSSIVLTPWPACDPNLVAFALRREGIAVVILLVPIALSKSSRRLTSRYL